MHEVIIVGGGIAGLSAALLLGRGGRRTLVCDGSEPRNAPSRALHGLLSRDGIDPLELRRIAREQLEPYPSVELCRAEVREAKRVKGGFRLRRCDGAELVARKLLLATGVVDVLPAVPGAAELFGRGLYHCPYCDGWEVHGKPLAALGGGHAGLAVARELTGWSEDVVLCSDGPAELSAEDRQRLARVGIALDERRVSALEEAGPGWVRVRFAEGAGVVRSAVFFPPAWRQRCDLAERLGCRLDEHGLVRAEEDGATEVPGLFVAGDSSPGIQLAAVAAAEGARAAVSINTELLKEDLAGREVGRSPVRSRTVARQS